ncbi:MAG: undecaprenyldiphospho-muramoylpentapeptide beta-N-acetylglucosaminyltransferase [Pseudomonadota bacterium]
MKILIMAGGTGGHVFPALAVAHELRSQGHEVLWLGTRKGLEAEAVPRAGINISFVAVSGLRGKHWLTWVFAPYKLGIAFLQSLSLLWRLRPNVVLGMGGFVTGPAGFGAWLLDLPLVIHEQNAVAGATNRLLAPLADRVLEAFPGSLPAKYKPVHTGNPVRAEIARLPAPEERLRERDGALRLLVLGGSLGAQALNETVPKCIRLLTQQQRPEIWHQTGARHIEAVQRIYQNAQVAARIVPFIDDMAAAYAWADVVLCRAGALTIAELAAAGVAALLVPYPHAVDDHQTHNARYLADAGAAVLIPQDKLTPAALCELLKEFTRVRTRLLSMAQAARARALPDATAQVARACLEVARG